MLKYLFKNLFTKISGNGRREEIPEDNDMILIAGLGNPGKKYEHTRHNMGFDCLDALAEKYSIRVGEAKFNALIGEGFIEGQKVMLMKPLTFMNLSGEAIGEAARYYHLDPETEVIVLVDDIATDMGMIRVRKKGSAGGHNGLKSIIAHLGTEGFTRIKLGVGDSFRDGELVDHVLGHISGEDKALAEEEFKNAVTAIEYILQDDIEKAMNEFNRKRES